MIEKYFQKGVRFKWIPPRDDSTGIKDGSVIPSPPQVLNPLIYDGLDGELMNHGLGNVSTLGFAKNQQINYQWLVYSTGHTTKKMLSAGDTLTGYMSGCLITTWSENGMRYVGHVGTVDGNAALNALVRNGFNAYAPADAVGFNPAGAWSPNEVAALQSKFKGGAEAKVLALVTGPGSYYSILMFKLPAKLGASHTWCVGGSKHIPPMNPAMLRAALTAAGR